MCLSTHRAAVLLRSIVILMMLLLPFAATMPQSVRADDKGGTDPTKREVQVLKQVTIGNQVQTTVSIPASQATFLASGQPNNNYGFLQNMNLGYAAPTLQAMRILIQFNFSSIPSNANISSAQFQIYQYASSPGNDSPMGAKAQLVGQQFPWNEASATWNNANNIGGPQIGVGNVSNQLGWQYFDVTQLTRDWVSGAAVNNGMLFTGDESPSNNRSRYFYSNYAPSGLYPRIVVQYTSQCDTIPPTATITGISPQINGASPNTFTVSWSGYDSAPSGCTPSGIANYTVWYQLNGGAFVRWLDGVTSTSASFDASSFGAINGTIVGFRARACDNAGNCQQVGDAQAGTTVDTLGPTAAINPLPKYTTSNNFLVGWSADDFGLSGVAFYNVQQMLNNGPWQNLAVQTTATSAPISGAQTGQIYGFRVQAVDNLGNVGNWSLPVTTTIFANPFAVLQQIVPPIIQKTTPNSTTITLEWTGYTPAGTTITAYRVFYNYNNSGWIAAQASPLPGGTTGSYAFDWKQRGLGDGTYIFKVQGTNNLSQQTPADFPYGQASVIVDIAGIFKYHQLMPFMAKEFTMH